MKVAMNGNGWRVAIFLAGGMLGSIGSGGLAHIQTSAVEERLSKRYDSLEAQVSVAMREQGALLREIGERLARIEGELAKR